MIKKLFRRGSTLFFAAALAAALAVSARAAEFSDVPAGHWAGRDISQCVRQGIVSGYGDGTFRPGAALSVAQFCDMLTRAFYPEEAEREGQLAAWYFPAAHILEKNGLLAGTGFARSDEAMDRPITRYDMVQLACNVLAAHGKSTSESQRAAAQVKIGDWNSIPAARRTAVSAAYVLGVTDGCDGSFAGERWVSRAQGCAVVRRMLDCAASDAAARPVKTAPVSTAAEHVLANGQPVSEANIVAAMDEVRQAYPTGTSWSVPGSLDPIAKHNPYGASQQLQQAVFLFGVRTDLAYGPGGFAALCDMQVWGSNAELYYRRVADLRDTRPGDLIVRFNRKGLVLHVMVAYGCAYTDSDGNIAVAVSQSVPGGRTLTWDTEAVIGPNDSVKQSVDYFKDNRFEVFTRYPD